MLTQSENDSLTRVGPGTPAGELLRRYWHPVAAAIELTADKPVKAVKILGEDLVVYRMPGENGEAESYGLIAERCPHRNASLKFGIVEPEGIRCIYHGWKFDPAGACLEQPAEDPASTFKDRIQQRAYPVQKLAGLLFAYLGPLPAPLLPRWDVLVRDDGRRWGVIEGVVDCNWLQAMENSVDPSHLYWLHGTLGTQHLPRGAERFTALGLPEKYQEQHEFSLVEHGIMKRRITRNGPDAPPLDEQHPLVFPTALRLIVSIKSIKTQGYVAAASITAEEEKPGYAHSMQFRTPIDDEHLLHYMVNFLPSETHMRADADPPFEYAPFKDAEGAYRTDYVTAQDALAWEAQGPITDRTSEHLGASDRGVVMLRKLVKEQIDVVREGGDPLGVLRDPAKNQLIEFDIVHEPFGIYRTTAV